MKDERGSVYEDENVRRAVREAIQASLSGTDPYEMIGCHFCPFEGRSLSEVWYHEEKEHPEDRAEEDAAIEAFGEEGV